MPQGAWSGAGGLSQASIAPVSTSGAAGLSRRGAAGRAVVAALAHAAAPSVDLRVELEAGGASIGAGTTWKPWVEKEAHGSGAKGRARAWVEKEAHGSASASATEELVR